MQKKRFFYLLLAAICAILALNACRSKQSSGIHEPITIQASMENLDHFIALVHETYPEINLKVIPYSGANYSAYCKAQLIANDMPDIYCARVYAPGEVDLSDRLIDLSGYDFTSEYSEAQLREVTDDGAIYMLPTYYDCLGITYNKTLLEKNGWKLPTSFRDLEELAPKVEEAGYQLCLNQTEFPGYGFQYLCNILDTTYFNTVEGRIWQKKFLAGEATVADTAEMQKGLQVLEKWRDLGMLNGNGSATSDGETQRIMAEGNTLFMLGNANDFTDMDTKDQFGLMPYLSADGTQNAYILNLSRFLGLNKNLEKKGNEQKLTDALHVMEVLSTVDGMLAFNGCNSATSLLPLKDYTIDKNNIYAEIQSELNAGYTAPFIYAGWENLIVEIGETMLAYSRKEASLADVVQAFDQNQSRLWDNNEAIYTTVTEKIDTENCAKLMGICMAQASGADLALISTNKWYELTDAEESLNQDGVSGALYPLPVTDDIITTILPTSWHGNIQTVTLSGRQIRELLQTGYDRNENGKTFPYVPAMPEGMKLNAATTYTVAIAGVTSEVAKEGKLRDTGILGLDAARKYFSRFESFSTKDIVWEKADGESK